MSDLINIRVSARSSSSSNSGTSSTSKFNANTSSSSSYSTKFSSEKITTNTLTAYSIDTDKLTAAIANLGETNITGTLTGIDANFTGILTAENANIVSATISNLTLTEPLDIDSANITALTSETIDVSQLKVDELTLENGFQFDCWGINEDENHCLNISGSTDQTFHIVPNKTDVFAVNDDTTSIWNDLDMVNKTSGTKIYVGTESEYPTEIKSVVENGFYIVDKANNVALGISSNYISTGLDIGSPSFTSGSGNGWRIQNDGTAEFSNVKVNGNLDVYVITYNEMRATNGILLVTDTGLIEKVTKDGDEWIFTINEYPPFVANDYVQLQYKASETLIWSFKGLVVSVNKDGDNTVRVTPNTGFTGGSSTNDRGETTWTTVDPDSAVNKYLIRIGNKSDENRLTIIKLNPYDGAYIDFMKQLNSESVLADVDSTGGTVPTNVRIGNLEGIVWNGTTLEGQGLYAENAYLTGAMRNLNSMWEFNKDGSGQLAGGKIKWTANGELSIDIGGIDTTELENRISACENDIDNLEGNVSSNTEEITNISNKQTSLEATVDGLSSTVSSQSTSISNLDGRVTSNETNISKLQLTDTSILATLASHTSSISSLNSDVDNLEDDVATNTSNIATNKTNIETNKTNIASVQATANSLSSTVSSHTTSINTLTNKQTTLENSVSTITQTADKISAKIGKLTEFNNIIPQSLIGGSIKSITRQVYIESGTTYIYTYSAAGTITTKLNGTSLSNGSTYTASTTGYVTLSITNSSGYMIHWLQLEEGQIATDWGFAQGDYSLETNNLIVQPFATGDWFSHLDSGVTNTKAKDTETGWHYRNLYYTATSETAAYALGTTVAPYIYDDYNGSIITYYVIAKPYNSRSTTLTAGCYSSDDSGSYNRLTNSSDKISLGYGWYLYFVTFTSAYDSICTLNWAYGITGVVGRWYVADFGVLTGFMVPPEVILNRKLTLETGIDIENRKITLTADTVVVLNNSGTQTALLNSEGKLNTNIVEANKLTTTGSATITLLNGLMQVAGTDGSVNIQIGVDSSGNAILQFILNGEVLYDLGPNGITYYVEAKDNSWSEITTLYPISDVSLSSNQISSADIYGSKIGSTSTYYKFNEGYKLVSSVKTYRISGNSNPSTYNGRAYTAKSSKTANNITSSDLNSLTSLSGWYRHYAVLEYSESIGSSSKTIYAVQMWQYTSGKKGVTYEYYFYKEGSKYYLCDIDGNKLNVDTYPYLYSYYKSLHYS